MKKTALFLIFCLACAPLFAKGPLALYLAQHMAYSDNIYFTPSDNTGSLISTTYIHAYPNGFIPDTNLYLLMDGYLGFRVYSKDPGENHSWLSKIDVEVENPNLFFKNLFEYGTESEDIELQNNEKHFADVTNFIFRSSPENKLGAGLVLNNEFLYYTGGNMKDANYNIVSPGARVYYNHTSKSNLFFEYLYSNSYYFSNRDSDFYANVFSLGAEGRVTAKVNGEIKVSRIIRTYLPNINGDVPDSDIWGYSADITYEPTTRSKISFTLGRGFEQSVYGLNRFYLSNYATLNITQKIYTRCSALFNFAYTTSDYHFAEPGEMLREDEMFTFVLGLQYTMPGPFDFVAVYRHDDRSSNIREYNFKRNIFQLNIMLYL